MALNTIIDTYEDLVTGVTVQVIKPRIARKVEKCVCRVASIWSMTRTRQTLQEQAFYRKGPK